VEHAESALPVPRRGGVSSSAHTDLKEIPMKGLVLSGGTGTRLRPFTYSIPKQLIPIANKPVLQYCIENIRDVGITEIGMIVGERNGQVESAIGDGSHLGVNITYIFQEAPLGLAHCVAVAEDFLGDEDFMMYLGDNMLIGGLAEAARDFQTHRPAAKVMVTKVDDDPSLYGVAELDSDGRVLSLVEKPQQPISDLAVMGVYFFTPAIHDSVARIEPSARGELEITDAIADLLTHDQLVTAEIYTGYWKDTGGIEALLECNRVLLDDLDTTTIHGDLDTQSTTSGTIIIEPGATVTRSRLTGPVVIGTGTVITDCDLGPHASIGHDCTLSNASVRDSIVLDEATVEGVTGIRDSVIGRKAHVHATAPGGQRLLIGDQAYVKVTAA
jgi:glucose-1-phosphate thymidylyltransferase